MARKIDKICKSLKIPWIYKSCYDKDCRSSLSSFHGVGIDEGLRILEEVRNEFGIPIVSDFSDPSDADLTGNVCDLIQVPAYLCRQTSILRAASLTKKPIHLKKGQFMSPWNMKNSVRKIEEFKNKNILLQGSKYVQQLNFHRFLQFYCNALATYPKYQPFEHYIHSKTFSLNLKTPNHPLLIFFL